MNVINAQTLDGFNRRLFEFNVKVFFELFERNFPTPSIEKI